MKNKTLADLKIEESGKVVRIKLLNSVVKRHLLDMGITRGVIIKIKKIAPMGDPITIELRDYKLTLRKKDLKQIEVEVVDD